MTAVVQNIATRKPGSSKGDSKSASGSVLAKAVAKRDARVMTRFVSATTGGPIKKLGVANAIVRARPRRARASSTTPPGRPRGVMKTWRAARKQMFGALRSGRVAMEGTHRRVGAFEPLEESLSRMLEARSNPS